MAYLNAVHFIGRLTDEPEQSYLPNGKAKTVFSLAVTRRRYSKDQAEETDFIPCIAWDKLAEIIGQYGRKGKLAYVGGELRTRTFEKDGVKRKVFEILVNEFRMLSPNESGGQQRQQQSRQIPPKKDLRSDDPFAGIDDEPF